MTTGRMIVTTAMLLAAVLQAAPATTVAMTAPQPPEATTAPAAASAPAQTAEMLLRCRIAGSEQGLWLIRTSPDGKRYDLLCRGVSKKWVWLGRSMPSPPSILIPVGDRAHLLNARSDHRIIGMQPGAGAAPGPLAADEHWPPQASIVAGCEAMNFAGVNGWCAVVIVARPGDPAASAPATAPSAGTVSAARPVSADARPPVLGLFRYSGSTGWQSLGDLPAALSRSGQQTFVIVNQGRLVVLAASEKMRLGLWENNTWTVRDELDVPESLQALTLAVLAGQSVIAARGPLESGKTEAPVMLVTLDAAGNLAGKQTLRRKDQPVLWPVDAPLLAGRLGDQLALIDQPDPKTPPQMTLTGLDGHCISPEPIQALSSTGESKGLEILTWFAYVIFGLVIFCVVIRRPTGPPGLFVVPDATRPAAMGKRFLAALIDLAPFGAAIMAIELAAMARTAGGLDQLTIEQYQDSQELVLQTLSRPEVAWGIVICLGSYVLYTTLMELRYGATLGKMLLGLRVVDDTGSRPDLRAAVVRNLTRLIILLVPNPLAILLLFPLLNINRQRLGDLMARTAVIERRAISPTDPDRPTDLPPDDSRRA